MGRIISWVRRPLWEVVPRDHRQPSADLRRRQLITAGFGVVGAVVLGASLHLEPGTRLFYPATLLLAAVWVVGALCSGELHLGRIRSGARLVRPVVPPVAVGLVLAGVFVLGALVVRELPYLGDRVSGVLDYAAEGSMPLVVLVTAVNGVAEELFFRGAFYAAVPRHPVLWTTVGYTVVTLATGNVVLSLAAVVLGLVVGLERRASGGVLAPVLTHVSWSVTVLLALSPLFS